MAILKAIKYSAESGFKPLSHTASGLGIVLNYATQGEKTKDENEVVNHVSGIKCNPMFAKDEFLATKTIYAKRDGVMFYHYVQSFAEDDDITPEEAHQIGLEFAEKAWPDYEVVVATHTDTHCLHNHFIINSVNSVTGEKYRTNYSHLRELREISDEICLEHGLGIITPKKEKKTSGGPDNKEYQSAKKGESWKFRLRSTIKRAMEKCGTKEAFIKYMNAAGYEVRWDDSHKNIKYTCKKEKKYKNGKYREVNDDKLSDEKYLKGNMENEFEIRKKDEYGRAYGAESGERRSDKRDYADGDIRKSRSETDGSFGAGRDDFGADQTDKERTEYSGNRGRSSNVHGGTKGDCGTEKSEFGSGMGEETRRTETGWESERKAYRKHRESYKSQHRGTHRGDKQSMWESGADSIRRNTGSRVGLGLLSLASIIEADNKTKEEIEAEERARIAAGNFGAVAGTLIGIAMEKMKNNEPSENEYEEAYEDENIENDEEEESTGFYISM